MTERLRKAARDELAAHLRTVQLAKLVDAAKLDLEIMTQQHRDAKREHWKAVRALTEAVMEEPDAVPGDAG